MTPTEVLVAHQRRDSGSCLCGWAVLGASHAEHQVAEIEAAGYVIRLRDYPGITEPTARHRLKVSKEKLARLREARDELKEGGPIGVMSYCHHCRMNVGRDGNGVVWQHAKSCRRI